MEYLPMVLDPVINSLTMSRSLQSHAQPSAERENLRTLASQPPRSLSMDDIRLGDLHPNKKRGRPLGSKNKRFAMNTSPKASDGYQGKAYRLSVVSKDLVVTGDSWDPAESADPIWALEDGQEIPRKRAKTLHHTQPNTLSMKRPAATLDEWANDSTQVLSAPAIVYGQISDHPPRTASDETIYIENHTSAAQPSLPKPKYAISESSSPTSSPFQRSRVPSLESRTSVYQGSKAQGMAPWFLQPVASRGGEMFTYEHLDWPLPGCIVPDDEEPADGVDAMANWLEQRRSEMDNDNHMTPIELYLSNNTDLGKCCDHSESVRTECNCIVLCADDAGTQTRDELSCQVHILEKQILYERTLYADAQKEIEHEIETLVRINEGLLGTFGNPTTVSG